MIRQLRQLLHLPDAEVRNLAQHVATWGYPPKLVQLLQQCNSQGAIGLPQTSCVRLIHVTSASTECVDAFNNWMKRGAEQARLPLMCCHEM